MVHRYQAVQGLTNLREIILTKLQSENHLSLSGIEQIVVTAGSNMGFMNAILAITQPGDEIILQVPYYFNHEMAIRMASCTPVLVQTTSSFQLDIDAIAQAITDQTKAIVTISPNNPTGAVYPKADLKAINELCRDRGLFHISDEAYEYFVYGPVEHTSPAQFDPQSDHTISLFSLSKAFGFAGWRIGYMVIPNSHPNRNSKNSRYPVDLPPIAVSSCSHRSSPSRKNPIHKRQSQSWEKRETQSLNIYTPFSIIVITLNLTVHFISLSKSIHHSLPLNWLKS